MKKSVFCFIALAVVLVVTSCQSAPINLVAIETPDSEYSLSRGVTICSTKNDNIIIAATGNSIDNGEANVLISLVNTDSQPYTFNESDVLIYYGNYYEDRWQLLEKWSATGYYEDAYKAYKANLFWTAFAGALNTFNAAMGSTSRSYTTSYNGYYTTTTTRTYNYSDVAMASMVADMKNAMVKKEGESYLNYIKNNLLYSSTIPAMGEYSGWVIFKDMKKKGPDYRIDIVNTKTGNISCLYFTRTDRSKLVK